MLVSDTTVNTSDVPVREYDLSVRLSMVSFSKAPVPRITVRRDSPSENEAPKDLRIVR